MCRLGRHITVHPDRVAIVDAADYDALRSSTWFLRHGRGGEYAFRKIQKDGKRKVEYMHRVIMQTPRGIEVHHKNCYGLDNRRINMINVTKAEHADIQRIARIAKTIPVN